MRQHHHIMLFQNKNIFYFCVLCQLVTCVQSQYSFLNQFLVLCTPSFLKMFPNDFNSSVEMYLSLVDRENPSNLKSFKLSDASKLLLDNKFNGKYKTTLYIHGHMDMPSFPLSKYVVQGYTKVGGLNIILYDMNHYLSDLLYPREVKIIPDLGRSLGEALVQMFSAGFDINNLDVVGHSLGAHIAGFAGKTFYKLTKRKLPTIVGLDPAAPCFSGDENSRLNADDAEFVEAIHTNAGTLGFLYPIGSVDIYINGGKIQPGYNVGLSHIKAVSYWLKAVQHPKYFKAHKCENLNSALLGDCKSYETITMGQHTDRNATGIYHLKTSGQDALFSFNKKDQNVI